MWIQDENHSHPGNGNTTLTETTVIPAEAGIQEGINELTYGT